MNPTDAVFFNAGVLLQRIRGEFQEMPGLRLTKPQACRLWHLDATECQALLEALIDARFLVRTKDGFFVKA
jgi:hypothetical protein